MKAAWQRFKNLFGHKHEAPVTNIRMPEQPVRKQSRALSKNRRLYRIKSACGGFSRLVGFRYGDKIMYRGPTHFTCGPGFPKIKK